MTDNKTKPSPGAIDYDLLPGWHLLGGGAFSWRLLASVLDPANPTRPALVLRRDAWVDTSPRSPPRWHAVPEAIVTLSAGETARLIEVIGVQPAAPETVVTLNLCESEILVLAPDRLYRFEVAPGCARCAELAEMGALDRAVPNTLQETTE